MLRGTEKLQSIRSNTQRKEINRMPGSLGKSLQLNKLTQSEPRGAEDSTNEHFPLIPETD